MTECIIGVHDYVLYKFTFYIYTLSFNYIYSDGINIISGRLQQQRLFQGRF